MKSLQYVFCLALIVVAVPILACAGAPDLESDETAVAETAATPAEPAAKPAEPAAQAQAAGQAPTSQPATRPKFVAPIRGTAEILYTKPATKVVPVKEGTKVVREEVVTTIKLKNVSTGAIAGLRCDEFWWDAANNTLPGGSMRLRQPLLPGEEATVELRVPKNPKMHRNSYQFSHANGQIKAKLVPKL